MKKQAKRNSPDGMLMTVDSLHNMTTWIAMAIIELAVE
jgi:hypothetical protein